MEIMILSADTPKGTRAQIEAGLNKIASILGPLTSKTVGRSFVSGAKTSFAVVIDGDTPRHALMPAIKPLFLNLGTHRETVVCCRVLQGTIAKKVSAEKKQALFSDGSASDHADQTTDDSDDGAESGQFPPFFTASDLSPSSASDSSNSCSESSSSIHWFVILLVSCLLFGLYRSLTILWKL
jgi:hypothetical protein